MDPEDARRFSDYLAAMGRKITRQEVQPILLSHLGNVVKAEKAILAPHSKSGALEASLQERAGSGDRGDRISAFASAALSRAKLIEKWSGGRRQQKQWAAGLARKGRRKRVFYDVMVESGHRIVKRAADGTLVDTGRRTRPVHFARGAMQSVGESEAEAAAQELLDLIMGG